MLSAVIRGMVEFGWYANFSYCRRISILDQTAPVRVIATGELVYDREYLTENATATA